MVLKFQMHVVTSVALIAMLNLAGCATSEKIQAVQLGDNNLNCAGIKTELAKLDKATADIEAKKGVTGTNVASALLFLPGLAYTYYDAGQASRLISERRSNLTGSYNDKKCQ